MSLDRIVMTKQDRQALERMIQRSEERARKAGRDKAASGAGTDTWHDEGFRHGLVEEAGQNQRTDELQAVLDRAEVVVPKEQAVVVDLGCGIEIQRKGEEPEQLIIVGYAVGVCAGNSVSYRSPFFAQLKGAMVGDERICGNTRVEILRIIPPSVAYAWLSEALKEEDED